MGLDISAYRQIKKVDCVFDSGGDPIDPATREYIDYSFRAFCNPDFPGRADDLEDGAIYDAEDSMGVDGIGYGGFNHWRSKLAEIAGWPLDTYEQWGRKWPSHAASAWKAQGGPFWELILFTDCDGTIGAAVAAKLAKDFADYDSKAAAAGDEFYDFYKQCRAAFEMAADGGAVRFQ